MALFDPTDTDGFGIFNAPGLMGGGAGGDIRTTIGALGQSLLTSPRQAPFQNFSAALAQAEKQNEQAASRKALVAVLVKAGMSQQEAEAYAVNPLAAKLAIETQTTAKGEAATRRAMGIMGGGDDAAGSGGSPRMSPTAPGGPAAGVSLNGDAANSFVDTLIGKESGGNPNAKNPNSSASGLTQFTSGTWGEMMRQHPELGLTPDGRTDPDQARRAALAYAGDNGQVLAQAGHEATPGNLYLGHFLGGPGASRFLTGLKRDPTAPALSYADPDAVSANRTVFYNRDGSPKSAQAFYAERTSRFGQAAPQRVASAGSAVDVPALLADFQPSTADPYSSGPPASSSPAGSRGSVQIAETEADVQRLEGQLGMVPGPGRNQIRREIAGASPTPQADLPSPDAREAEFRIPGDGSPSAAPSGTVFDDKSAAMRQLTKISQALAIPNLPEATRRQLEAAREQATAILKPTDQTRKLIDAGYQPGTPEFQAAARRLTFGEKDDKDKIVNDARQREQIAGQYGLIKGAPGYANFILTGKLPNEERPGPSATDKKAIFDAENSIAPLDSTLDTLRRAKELNGKTFTGYLAGVRGKVGSSLPDWVVPDFIADPKTSADTREFGQLMSMEAIKSMSQTLKGATTDREMDRFMEILGDPTTPPAIRERTIDRMIKLTEQQRELAQTRVDELRGGTYFKRSEGERQGAGRQQERPVTRQDRGVPAFSASELEAEARRRGLIQ